MTTAQNFEAPVSEQLEKIQQIKHTGIDASLFLEELLSNEVEGVDDGLTALSPNTLSRLTAAMVNGFEGNNEEAEIFASPPLANNFEDAEILPRPVLLSENIFNGSLQTISEAPLSVDNVPHTVIPIPVTTSKGPIKSLPYSLPHHQEQDVEWESAYAGGEVPVDLLPHHQALRRQRPRLRYRNRRPYRTRRIIYHDPHYFCSPYDHSHNDTLDTSYKHPVFLPRRPEIPPPTLKPKPLEFPRVPTPPEIVPVPEVVTISFANAQPAQQPTPAPQVPVPSIVPRLPIPSPFVPVEPLTPDIPVSTFRPASVPKAIATPIATTIPPPVPITFRPANPTIIFRQNTPLTTPITTQPTTPVQKPAPSLPPQNPNVPSPGILVAGTGRNPGVNFPVPLTTTSAPMPITSAPPFVTTEPDYEYMDDDYFMDEEYYMNEAEDDYYIDDGLTRSQAEQGTKTNDTSSGGGIIKSFRANLIPVIILVEPDKIPEGAIPMFPLPTATLSPTTANTPSTQGPVTGKSVGNKEKIPVIILVEPDKIPEDSIPINTDSITTTAMQDPTDYDVGDYDYDIDDVDYDTGNVDYDTGDYDDYDEYADGNDYDVDVNSSNDNEADFDNYEYDDNDYADSYEYENSGLLPLFPGPRGSARLRNRGRLQGRSRRNRNRGKSQRQQRVNQEEKSSRLVQVPSRNQRRPNLQQTRQRNQRPSRLKLKEAPIISSDAVNFRERQEPVFSRNNIPQQKLTGLDLQQNPSRVDTLTGSKERVVPFPSWLDNDYSFPGHEDYYVDEYAYSEPQDLYIPPKHPDYRDFPDYTIHTAPPVAPVLPNSHRASSPNFVGGKIPAAGQLPRPDPRSRGLPEFPRRRVTIPRNPPLPPLIPREPLVPVAPPPPLALPNPGPGLIPVAVNGRNPRVNRPRQPSPQFPNAPIPGIPVAGTGRNPGINFPRQPFPQNPNVPISGIPVAGTGRIPGIPVTGNRRNPGVNRPRQPFPIPGSREDILPGTVSSGFSPGRDIEIQTIPNPRNRNRGNLQPRTPLLQENFSNDFEDFGEDFEVFRPEISQQNGAIPEKISELRHSIVSKARSWTQFGLQRTRPEFIRTRRPDPQPQHIVIFQ